MKIFNKKKKEQAAKAILENYSSAKRFLSESNKKLPDYLNELEELNQQTWDGLNSIGFKPGEYLDLLNDKAYIAKVKQYNLDILYDIAEHTLYEIESGGYRSFFDESMKQQFLREMRSYNRDRLLALRYGKLLDEI